MREFRHGKIHRFIHLNLLRRIAEMVVAANDVRNVHADIVHHDAEVIGRAAICAENNQIIEFRIRKDDFSLHKVRHGRCAL